MVLAHLPDGIEVPARKARLLLHLCIGQSRAVRGGGRRRVEVIAVGGDCKAVIESNQTARGRAVCRGNAAGAVTVGDGGVRSFNTTDKPADT